MTTQTITYIKRPAGPDGCWQVQGSTWSTLAGPWLIAHDLFHHAPGDTGSVAEELATIGSELYISHEDDTMASLPPDAWVEGTSFAAALIALSNSSNAIVGMPFDEGIAHPKLYQLPVFPESQPLPDSLEHVLDRCARSAVDGLGEIVMTDEGWVATRASFTVPKVVALMRHGYHQARARFPDRAAVQAAFTAAKATLAGLDEKPDGTIITVRRTGLVVTVH